MGDARIGSDLNTIASDLLNTTVNSATYGVATVGDFYAEDNESYDWGADAGVKSP